MAARRSRGWQLSLVLILALAAVSLRPGRSAQAGAAGTPNPPVYGDDRFGVTLTGDPQQLLMLGSRWFITYGGGPTTVPPGAVWVQYADVTRQAFDQAGLAARVASYPGSYWLISNEPNVTASPQEQTGAQYAASLHDMVGIIKGIDPSAKIVGPNIINFDFTCLACPGYTSGHAFMDGFLAAYQAAYASLPPIDVWSIHTYPLDFEHFPQVQAGLMEEQLQEFRDYLDAVPGLEGAPIWDTEVGTHWGYEGLDWRDDGSGTIQAYPVGAYRTDLLLGYMQTLLGWLSANGPALQIDRWFFFATYFPNPEPWESVYGGINLLDGPSAAAQLSPFGRLYRRLAGLSPNSNP